MASNYSNHSSDRLKLKVRDQVLIKNVTLIRFLVHKQGYIGGTECRDNHVTQVLEAFDGSTVQINMRPRSRLDMYGVFEAESCASSKIDTEIVEFAYKSDRNVSVEMLLDALMKWRFNHYWFADERYGTRYWHITAMRQYEQEGWVTTGSGLKLLQQLSYRFSDMDGPVPVTIIPGTFNLQTSRTWVIALWQRMCFEQYKIVQEARRRDHELRCVSNNMANNNHHEADLQILRLRQYGVVLAGADSVPEALATASQRCTVVQGVDSLIQDIIDRARRLCDERPAQSEEEVLKSGVTFA